MALAFVLVLTVLVMPGAAWAQGEVSLGCSLINDPFYDDQYGAAGIGALSPLAAGDHITLVANEPPIGETATGIQLLINGQVVDQDGVPGTLEYIVPVDGGVDVYWKVTPDGVNVPWAATCEPGLPTTPTCNGPDATIYVKDGVIVGGPNNGATYTGTLAGTSGGDVIVGTDGRDAIDARAGNDTICGLGGNDTIEGAAGNDTMLGGSGADKLNGASGTDTTPDFSTAGGDKRTNVP
jgi:Ca2+-binding RTX toxin-like protein